MSFRLCSRAPWTISSSAALRRLIVPGERLFVYAAPGPLVGVSAEPGPDRIPEDVGDRPVVVLVVPDDPAGEPVAPQMAPAAVTCVELLGVDAFEAMEASGEERQRGLHEQVVVGRQEREGMHAPAESIHGSRQEGEECAAIVVVADDRAAVD